MSDIQAWLLYSIMEKHGAIQMIRFQKERNSPVNVAFIIAD